VAWALNDPPNADAAIASLIPTFIFYLVTFLLNPANHYEFKRTATFYLAEYSDYIASFYLIIVWLSSNIFILLSFFSIWVVNLISV
jgi:F0F1-type ATP synthase assembly protein I